MFLRCLFQGGGTGKICLKTDNSLNPTNWTYLYDYSPLAKTLDKYIDYKNLTLLPLQQKKKSRSSSSNYYCSRCRDSDTVQKWKLNRNVLLGSAGYPLYGFPWIEIQDGVNAWDGSLIYSNTPVREI